MDKEDLRRVFSRLSKHSDNKKHHHQHRKKKQKQKQQKQEQEFVISGSKKEKLKRLISVVASGSDDQEPEKMGSVGSDVEDEVRPSSSTSPTENNNKFKLPKKFLEDCGSVDHASVPRKLRSAIRNRTCKSNSPPLPSPKKRMNNSVDGFETPRNSGTKRLKLTRRNGCSDSGTKNAVSQPITKDEEEVAETLFALAGMIPPGDDLRGKKKLDGGEPLVGKMLDKSQKLTDSIPVSKDPKDDQEGSSNSVSGERTKSNPSKEQAPRGKEKMDTLDNPILSDGKGLNLNAKTFTSPFDRQTISSMVKSEGLSPRPSQSSICLSIGAQQNAAHVISQVDKLQTPFERKEYGLTLSPGLPSSGSHDLGASGTSIQKSAANLPPWLNAGAESSKARSNQYGMSNGVLGMANAQGKSWKRCGAHVYISRLIQVLKMSEGKDTPLVESGRMNSCEASKQQLFHTAYLNGVRNGSDGILSNGRMPVCPPLDNKNPNASNTGSQTQNRVLHHSLEQGFSSSAANKQSLDFLSLSTSTSEPGERSHVLRIENNLDQLAHLHVPYLQSLAQQNTIIPVSLPQVRQPSTIYRDQLSAAASSLSPQVQLQLPGYFGNSSGPSHVGRTSSRIQQAQLQSQQQQMWAAQLVGAMYRPGTFSTPTWRNRRLDTISAAQLMQTPITTSQSPLEALRSRYTAEASSQQQQHQQQQQLIALSSSLLHARERVQNNQLVPSNCEQNGGQFRPDGIPPLQLLCTERP